MTTVTQHTINTPYMVGPVHCYTTILAGEPVLFDTGPPTDEALRYLEKNIDLKNLKHVLITHCHIDHYGQASWLEENCGATIYVPYRDYLKLKEHERRVEQMCHLLLELGLGRKYLDGLRKVFESGVLFPPFPECYRVVETDLPERLGVEVLQCPGHSQSDVVYAFDEYVVTGDTMLKGIFQSPLLDVDLDTGRRFLNYSAYCASLIKLARLEGKTVLPGHRKNLPSIRQALLFYIEKLLVRAERLLPFQGEENLLFLLDKVMGGRDLNVFHIYLKASEIIFMKDLLAEPELLQGALQEVNLFDSVADLYDQIIS